MKMPPGVPGRVVAISMSTFSGFAVCIRGGGRRSMSVMDRFPGARAAANYSMPLFRLQAGRLDNRPPFVDLGLAQRVERFGRVLVAVHVVQAHLGHSLSQLGV